MKKIIDGWWSDDITFCTNNKCTRRSCMRNPKNIRNRLIPHSFADCEHIKGMCPKQKEQSNER